MLDCQELRYIIQKLKHVKLEGRKDLYDEDEFMHMLCNRRSGYERRSISYQSNGKTDTRNVSIYDNTISWKT